jgi:hypothetical protein
MNFSVAQWRALFILDTLIKALSIFGPAVLFSLGTIMLGGIFALVFFILLGAGVSGLHCLCLFLGSGIVTRLVATYPKLPQSLKFLLVLIVANLLFAASWTVLMSVGHGIYNGAIESLYLVATNLISLLPVAISAWIASPARRSH